MVTWDKWELPGGVALPVTAVSETLRFYELVERERTEDEALALADTVLTARLAAYMEEGQVLSRELTSQVVDGNLVVTLVAECQEQIGRLVEIPKD